MANRVHTVLHDANLKLGAVASDVLDTSGRAILRALLEGEEDPKQLAELALGQRLRKKIPQLRFRSCVWPWRAVAASIIATCCVVC